VDGGICGPPRKFSFVLQMLQTICLIPTRREYIERDLPPNRVAASMYTLALPQEVFA
jgi:hypothetical protein